MTMKSSMRMRSFSPIASGLLILISSYVMPSYALAAPPAAPEAAAPPSPPAATPKPRFSAVECEVWNRERSFAASVEHHDAAAFAEHVHAKAAFDATSPEPTRGR